MPRGGGSRAAPEEGRNALGSREGGSCGSWRGVSRWEGHSAGTHSHSGLPSCAENPQKVLFNLNFQIFPWKVEATSSWKPTPKCRVAWAETGCGTPSLAGREGPTSAGDTRCTALRAFEAPDAAQDAGTVLHRGGQG